MITGIGLTWVLSVIAITEPSPVVSPVDRHVDGVRVVEEHQHEERAHHHRHHGHGGDYRAAVWHAADQREGDCWCAMHSSQRAGGTNQGQMPSAKISTARK
jgi:hypothetical protein